MQSYQIAADISWIKIAQNSLKIIQHNTGRFWLIHGMDIALWNTLWLQFPLDLWQEILPEMNILLQNWLDAGLISSSRE